MWSFRVFTILFKFCYLTSQLLLVVNISHGLRISTTINNRLLKVYRPVALHNVLRLTTADDSDAQEALVVVSRRQALVASTASAFAFLLLKPATSNALETPPTKTELERIKVGYNQIQYLLNNFEKETTVCRVSPINL
jgi:hypothetical protein